MTESRAIVAAREELDDAMRLLEDADVKIQALSPDETEELRDFHEANFERAQKTVELVREKLERAIAIQKAKESIPGMGDGEPTAEERAAGYSGPVKVVREEQTYRR